MWLPHSLIRTVSSPSGSHDPVREGYILNIFAVVRERRRVLRQHFDVTKQFEELEETCVPSYVHANPLASGIAWWRLVVAAKLSQKWGKQGPILDFGAATGEVWHLLGRPNGYEFVEEDETMVEYLQKTNAGARRRTLEALPIGYYEQIFALDSLEHNDDVGELLARLSTCLTDSGTLILSGPTETWLYRLGRRLAGFSGHYHLTTIYDIERLAEKHFERLAETSLPVPAVAPLFRLTAWSRKP